MRDYRKMWKISLIVLACVTLIFAVTYFADITMPDMLIRILGTLSLCAIFELVFSSVKMNLPGASTQVSTGHLTRFASGVSGRFALRINA